MRSKVAIVLLILLLAACGEPGKNPVNTSPPVLPLTTESPTGTPTNMPAQVILPSSTVTLVRTPTPELISPPFSVCSPLADIDIPGLSSAISNPYDPPPPGSDLPHEGVDLAILLKGSGIALAGGTVQSALPGKIISNLNNRFPYGNALIIETPLAALPAEFVKGLDLPNPIPTLAPHPALTCPQAGFIPSWDAGKRSLYLVYAHLQEPSSFQVGDEVVCGQGLGKIGASGNALNPHLHLEARIGPAGARFDSMAHYDTSATPIEMETYCVWRVSGWFQLINPMRLFKTGE
jgi:murein DD-endopeptidase MepM/ murein hydrolase activator NlpD